MDKKTLETRRNLFHLIVGIIIIGLLYYGFIDAWILLGVILAGFALSMISIRFPLPVISWFLRMFEREESKRKFPGSGAFFAFVGILLAVVIFPRDVAFASIAILIIGDSIPPLIGMRFGKIAHPLSSEKVIEASLAGFAFAFIGALFFVSPAEALLGSAFAMTAEAVDTVRGRRIEDNVTIPLVAGLVMMVLRTLF